MTQEGNRMKIGDHIEVHGEDIGGLSADVHTLAITKIREESGRIVLDCATLDGELETQVFPSEVLNEQP